MRFSDKQFHSALARLTIIPVSQILPPLLLLPLFMAPFDELGIVLWMIGLLAALISILSLLVRMARKEERVYPWETMPRPLLTILIVSGAFGVGLVVQADSERYAHELVTVLQRACKEQGRCPVAPEGWQLDKRYARGDHRRVRATHGHWSFTYVTNPKRSEFEVWIHKAKEVEKCAHGGSLIALSEWDAPFFCDQDSKLHLNSFVDSDWN